MGQSAFESVFGLVFENHHNSILNSVKIRAPFPCTFTYIEIKKTSHNAKFSINFTAFIVDKATNIFIILRKCFILHYFLCCIVVHYLFVYLFPTGLLLSLFWMFNAKLCIFWSGKNYISNFRKTAHSKKSYLMQRAIYILSKLSRKSLKNTILVLRV